MKRLLTYLSVFSNARFAHAANEASDEAANEAAVGVFDVVDGGVMKVPYGEYPVMVAHQGRQIRGLQRVDAQAGNEMRADLGGVLKRFAVGRPIFAGHPYIPGDGTPDPRWPDRRSRGTIKEIEVANDGIVFVPKYNKLGREEVEDAQFMHHSPQWRLKPVMAANGKQEVKNGMPVYRPFSIHSVGLTNNPNIEVPALVAANENMPAVIDVSKLIAALAETGLVKPDDDELTILQGIARMKEDIQWARERKENDARRLQMLRTAFPSAANEATEEEITSSLITERSDLAAANEKLTEDVSSLRSSLSASREAHVEMALAGLITGAKITKAKAEEVRSSLIEAANEQVLADQLAELGKGKSKLSTDGGVTDELKGAHKVVMAANEQSARKRQRDELVNDVLAEITKGRAARPGDRETAWNLASARHPQLFGH